MWGEPAFRYRSCIEEADARMIRQCTDVTHTKRKAQDVTLLTSRCVTDKVTRMPRSMIAESTLLKKGRMKDTICVHGSSHVDTKLVWSPTPRRHAGTWCWAVGFHSQQHDEIVTSVSIFTLGLTTRVLLLLSINTAQHLQDLMIATSATMNRSAPRLLRATWQHRFPLSPSLALSGQRLVGNRTLSASTTALPKSALNATGGSQQQVNKWWVRAGALGLGLGAAQYQFGSAENFFDLRKPRRVR